MTASLARLDRVLKALADPTRLRIVGLLQGGEVCVCHLQDALRISQPKASRHLAYLRRAGVVEGEKRGLWVYYRLAPQQDAVAQAALDALRHCAGHLPAVRSDAGRLKKAIGCCPEPAAAAPGFACCGAR